MKGFISFLIFIVASFAATAQTYFTVKGKVINSETRLPLQSASVFAQNTTFGTATDVDGNFMLQLPYGGYNIIATFTGYSIESHRVSAADPSEAVIFEMKLKEKEMAEVSIVSTSEVRDGWEKYGSFFTEHFIGKTINSSNCAIKNTEVLKFFYSRKRNRLKVLASEPLQIENKALGYNIKYTLDSFTYDYASQVSLYTGYPLFEEMTPVDEAQANTWKIARERAYKGSILHFMRSVFNRELKEQGFEVQYLVRINEKEKAITLKNYYAALNYIKDDSTQTVEVKPNQQDLGVIYTKEKPAKKYIDLNPDASSDFQFSILTFVPAKPAIIIEQNGYYYDQDDLAISEYWTWDKIADLLPYDYLPSQ